MKRSDRHINKQQKNNKLFSYIVLLFVVGFLWFFISGVFNSTQTDENSKSNDTVVEQKDTLYDKYEAKINPFWRHLAKKWYGDADNVELFNQNKEGAYDFLFAHSSDKVIKEKLKDTYYLNINVLNYLRREAREDVQDQIETEINILESQS